VDVEVSVKVKEMEDLVEEAEEQYFFITAIN
jgi:hypothetical protein